MTFKFESGHSTLDKAFRIALGDLHSSILPHQSGLLDRAEPMMMAGLDYESPWTRDSSINSWNAGSLLYPEVARNTLLGVLERDSEEILIGGQYWDKIIWACGAWNHYLITGDRPFLELSYKAIIKTLAGMEDEEWDAPSGLFFGAACFQDGVAGYPDRYAKPNESCDIRDWVKANPAKRNKKGFGLPMKACSTNALYYAAYKIAADMAAILNPAEVRVPQEKAARMKVSFLANFWNEEAGNFFYLMDESGKCGHQEGLGASFAILFGLVTEAQVKRIFHSQQITPHGIPCVWPTFDRYKTPDGLGFGRHSGTVWPQVQGFWAEATARYGRSDLFRHEIMNLASKAVRDAQFTEIYHPAHGEIYGGRQEDLDGGAIRLWESCRRQTWSATAYLRMVLTGLFGLRFHTDGLSFQPLLMDPLRNIRISGLRYRNLTLSLQLTGSGNRIKRALKNGREQDRIFITSSETGHAEILIEVE